MMYNEEKTYLPVCPVENGNFMPNTEAHIFLNREIEIEAISEASSYGGEFILMNQKVSSGAEVSIVNLFYAGILCKIVSLMPSDTGLKVHISLTNRVRVIDYIKENGIIYANALIIKLSEEVSDSKKNEAYKEYIGYKLKELTSIMFGRGVNIEEKISNLPIDVYLDVLASNLNLNTMKAQNIISAVDIGERTRILNEYMQEAIFKNKIIQEIDTKTKNEMDKSQREYILKEQLKIIKNELGYKNKEGLNLYDGLKAEFEELELSSEVTEKAFKEIDKLEATPQSSPDYASTFQYLEILKSLPWKKRTKARKSLKVAKSILDKEHFGLQDIKQRILEYIAVLNNKGSISGSILCFVGPPGVGKTSIAKSIAHATNRSFVRMSLGGIRDEADIRGHMRTYVGSMPGRIISLMNKAKTKNPVFLFDEIDKIGQDFRGDPSSALLEVLDPSQNFDFSDRYLELPFDLSEVLFIATANSLDSIPDALMDRLEIIRIEGYTEDEKIEIAKNYLIPKEVEGAGLEKSSIKFEDDAIRDIINYYTRESGVRELERMIAKIVRKLVLKNYGSSSFKETVSVDKVEEHLDGRIFLYDLVDEKDEIGVVTGLAWTKVGGETLTIEATIMKGKGKIDLTGNLGEVMKESAVTALSYIRSNAEKYSIDPDYFENINIHVHIPEGAIPKDGPSAGITLTTAILSQLIKKRVNRFVAMTGEITLTGRVLQIGGLKEKVLAARRKGIRKIIIPKDNEKDLLKFPKKILDEIEFIAVSKYEEIPPLVFKSDKDDESE